MIKKILEKDKTKSFVQCQSIEDALLLEGSLENLENLEN
jgi:hypothetical protein